MLLKGIRKKIEMNWAMEYFTRILKRVSLLVLDKMPLVKLRHFISLYTSTFMTQKICYLISHVIRFHKNKIYFQQSKNSSFANVFSTIFFLRFHHCYYHYYYYFFYEIYFTCVIATFFYNQILNMNKETKVKQGFVSFFKYHNEYYTLDIFRNFLYVQILQIFKYVNYGLNS